MVILSIIGLWALLIPSSDQGYSCDPLIVGGDASDPEVDAMAGSFAPCDSDGRLVAVVAVLLVVAGMVALATIRRAARREQGHDDPVEVAGS